MGRTKASLTDILSVGVARKTRLNMRPLPIGHAMNAAKKALVSAKNKISDNKTKILGTIAVTATTVAVLQHYGIKSLNEFLDSKGLLDEYYALNED